PGRARPPSTRPPRSRQPARRAGRGATRAPAAGSDTARTAPVVPAEPPSSRPVRIPAPDEFFLQVETATNLQHVGGVAVLDVASAGPIDLDRLREHLAARLPALARMNRLLAARGRVRHGRWRPAGAVDLSWHVQEVHLPAPADGDTAADPRDRSALERVVGELMALPMDRDRPLWRMWLVHGVGPGLAAVVVIVHHAIGDGLGVVALLRELLDEPEALPADTGSAVLGRPLAPSALPAGPGTATAATPPPPAAAGPADPADPVDPAGVPDVAPELPVPAAIPRQPGRLIRAGLVISGVAALARDGRAPRLALSGPLSTARAYRTRQWPLTTLQGVARTLGVRVTDVLLAVIGEGVRAVLGASAEQAGPGGGARSRPAVLRAAVPITLRHPAAADELSGPGNLTAGLRLDVPLGDMTVLERVRLVAAEAERRRRSGRLPASAAVIRLLGILPAGLHARATQAIYQGRYFTAIVSNMRGADSELCLLGRPLVDVYPLLPLAQGVTVSAGSLGWDGRYCLSFTVDPAWVDPDLLVAAVEDAVERLLAQVGPTTTTASP
ncbi:MAG: DUF1298 domain-containing protein, partial [Frankia sp.]|nr:DUF1298 domain-containing protein [Frankia sp.]